MKEPLFHWFVFQHGLDRSTLQFVLAHENNYHFDFHAYLETGVYYFGSFYFFFNYKEKS